MVPESPSPAARLATKTFLEHRRFLKGLATYYAPWPDLADDILQDVFLEFVTKAERWDLSDPAKVKNLLGVLTRQIAMRHWQARRAMLSDVLANIASHLRQRAESDDDPPDFEEESAILKHCIELLPERGRTMIRLYYFEGWTIEELAGLMQMKIETACRTMSRLRMRLRQLVKKVIRERGIDDLFT